MPNLPTFLQSKIDLPAPDLAAIIANFQPKTYKKNRRLLRQGQIAQEYLYIEKGLLRIYYAHNDLEITGWIAAEGDFFCELNSLSTQTPTRFNIQAIEDTQVWTITAQRMEQLYQTYPAWQAFGRKIWERAFVNLVEGIISFQVLSAEQRYKAMLEDPNFQRIPLKYLASYLGVTPTSLSRLRKSIKG